MNQRTVDQNRRIAGSLRRVMPIMVLLLVASLAVRTWIVQGIVLPVRVVSGSMGARLPGPHWPVICNECEFAFRCGQDFPPRDNLAVCPNCGCGTNDLSDFTPQRGHRVLIDRLSVNLKPLRRWEMIAVRLPGSDTRMAVKRIVGLPGEHVSIRKGDVYVDGRIVRKELESLLCMSQHVHDSGYFPSRTSFEPRRWQPHDPSSRWKESLGGFRFAPDSTRSEMSQTRPADAPPHYAERADETPVDRLVYHHVPCLPAPSLRNRESPVLDNYAYNQGLTRQLNEVGDLLVTFRVKILGNGIIAVELHDGWSHFQLAWRTSDGSVRLYQESSEVASGWITDVTGGGLHAILCAACDRQFVFAVNGQTALTHPYSPKAVHRQPTSRPLAIGASGLSVEISELRVRRDIYYTHPNGSSEDWTFGRPLAANEYFLAGDNSPISLDGRHGPDSGIVSQQAIVGRVIRFPGSSFE